MTDRASALLKRQRVVERDGDRLEQREHRGHYRRPKRRCNGRRLRIEADQDCERPVATGEGQGDDASVRARSEWQVFLYVAGHELGAPSHDPAGRGPRRRVKVRCQAILREYGQLSVDVRHDDCPAGGRKPLAGLPHEPDPDLLRIERVIRSTNGLDHGVGPLQARLKCLQACLDVAGEVGRAGARNHSVRGVRLGGNRRHRSGGGESARAWMVRR